jgi:hypothetical protein
MTRAAPGTDPGTADPATDLDADLAPHLGRLGPWRWSRTEINQAEIWNFCEAVEDANPVYWDEATARASRFGRLIAPPQMLLTLMTPRPWAPDYVLEQERAERGAQGEDPEDAVRAILAAHGYGTATAVSRTEEYLEPFGPGDGRIRQAVRVEKVSSLKQTAVGPGVFVTTTVDYRTERPDRLVARATLVILRYAGGGTP